jgi:hypothetical protein
MKKLLFWITNYLPCRIINDGNRPYLERYYVGTLFSWRFYLHRFVDSDPNNGLHCHPWSRAFSVILSGWYFEQTRAGTKKVRWFNALNSDSFHRVILPNYSTSCTYKKQPCWTLFFHRVGNIKDWGFLRPVEEVNNFQYAKGAEQSGVMIYTPYTYAREGSQKNWWLTAKKGKAFRGGKDQ